MKAVRNLVMAAVAAASMLGASSSAWAGPVDGPLRRVTSVGPRETDTYHVTFHGGELAIVTVSGDGDTDLDLYVYDQFGNRIASDTDYTDQCVVTWIPRWTGRFTIRVVNRGYLRNFYTITAR